MEPSISCRARPSASCSLHHHQQHHHHHHPLIVFPHHHRLILCHHHNHHHHHINCHGHASSSFPLAHPKLVGADALQDEASVHTGATADHSTQMLREQEQWDFEEAEAVDEEDEPIYVLTDEWREFFAKSEAKRKLEKKLAKRKHQK